MFSKMTSQEKEEMLAKTRASVEEEIRQRQGQGQGHAAESSQSAANKALEAFVKELQQKVYYGNFFPTPNRVFNYDFSDLFTTFGL